MHLDATQLSFLQRLGKSPEGQQLLMLIQAEIDDANVALRKLSGEALLREQGRAVYLDEFKARLIGKSAPNVSKPPRFIDSTAP